jgi:hypothetical protein
MRTTIMAALVTGVALLLGSATVARAAADYCIDIADDGDTLVLKAFKVPAAGKCVDARGFYKAANFAGGAACTSSDGSALTVVLTATGGGGRRVDLLRLELPAQAGTGSFCELDAGAGGACFSPLDVARIPCADKKVPVP